MPKVYSRNLYCIVCGRCDLDVQRMYYFPTNKEKAQLWCENMGISKLSHLRTFRICNFHFTRDSFVNDVSLNLNRNAVPTIQCPAQAALHLNQVPEIIDSIDIVEATPSCSHFGPA